jgi:quinol---cytochrome c reductase iron-sulfur subunit, bacillus type
VSAHHDDKPHLPRPSLWPIGFAIGIVSVLVGLIVSWIVAAVGAVIAVVFGFLWARDVTVAMRTNVDDRVEFEPETRTVSDTAAPAAAVAAAPAAEEEVETYPRSVFLELTTLGLGGVIGGIVTLPVIGFAILPSFTNQKDYHVDLGPISNFEEGKFVIATYLEDPELGEVSRRTAYIRNNGNLGNVPSFTILYSRCVHLGCPVQPQGPTVGEKVKYRAVELTPVQPAGFGCPCHGGAYDTEGRRVAGPPVRSLDRYEFSIRNGNLWLGTLYSVGDVEGEKATAVITKYDHATPGVHVDGPEAWLYPIEVP